jgi:hypothetical protein
MRGAWWVAAPSALAACSFNHAAPIMATADGKLDDVALPDVPLGSWSAPVEITELTSGFGEDDPSLTADLLEIYFGTRRTANVGEDIWMARRASVTSPWSMVQSVSTLNTMNTETTGKITSDGMAIYFTRSVGGDPDIFAAARTAPGSTTWQSVARVDALSTSGVPDYGPAVRNDLLRVVLCRGSTVGAEALYVATRAAQTDPWSETQVIAELDEANISECDAIEPRDGVMYFASNRASDGRYDIFRTERAAGTDAWGPIVPVTDVNLSGFNERDPWVSADERYMVFASDRLGGDFRLFVTTR